MIESAGCDSVALSYSNEHYFNNLKSGISQSQSVIEVGTPYCQFSRVLICIDPGGGAREERTYLPYLGSALVVKD